MSIAIQTILNSGKTYRIQKEQELQPSFVQIGLIDPDRILKIEGDYFPETYQENIANETLSLHSKLKLLVGLLANAPSFERKLGENQIVDIGDFKENALLEPVSLDILDLAPHEKLPGLLLIGVSHSEIYHLPVISFEFCPNPEWSSLATVDSLDIILREKEIGERAKPSFYTSPLMPQGTGRLDCDTWRAKRSPIFFLLTYEPSDKFQISKVAVENFDTYLSRLDIKTGEIAF